MDMLDTLKTAQNALLEADLGAEVLLRGDPLPEDEARPLVILDGITSTPYGYDQQDTTVVQVSVYAATRTDALALAKATKAPLRAAGLLAGQQRAAPGTDPGYITDWRM